MLPHIPSPLADDDSLDNDYADPAAAAEAYQAEVEARLEAWRERNL